MKTNEQKLEQGLHGMYFHTFSDDGYMHQQGIVDTTIDAENYLVTFFSWLTGHDNGSKIVSVNEMKDWVFYDSHEKFIFASEYTYPCRFKEIGEKRRIERESKKHTENPWGSLR